MSSYYKEFINDVDNLKKKDRVLLKRNCGSMLSEADGQTLTVFYRLLPKFVKPYEEELWFLALCIHCLWGEEDNEKRRPMENQISTMKNRENLTDSFDHRFTTLLDTQWNSDGYLNQKVTRMAKLLKQKGYPVDGAALLDALLHWGSPNRYIQKKWIRAFCNTDNLNNNYEKNENKTEE